MSNRTDHASLVIVVIDDNAMNRQLLVTLLAGQGYRVFEANDGREGLHLARTVNPQVIISDILMPAMDGYEFVRQLRAESVLSHIEVIFYTAHYHEREAMRLAEACRVARVLSKPCEPKDLVNAVEQVAAHVVMPADSPSVDAAFDRNHLHLITNKLAEKADELQSANGRLTALTELNLQLASERDLHSLLQKVCAGARDLIGARYAVLAVVEKHDAGQLFATTSGLEPSPERRRPTLPQEDRGPLGRVYATRTAWRTVRRSPEQAASALPGFPAPEALLAVPICSLSNAYGWVCLADKIGGVDFAAEDEKLLATLAAQAGRIYENGSLHRQVQIHASQLQIEIDERKQAEAKIQHLNRVYAMLSAINSLIVRALTETELFTDACRIAVKHGDFAIAWVGRVSGDGELVPVACAGHGSFVVEAIAARKPLAITRDPCVAVAIDERRPQICNDLRRVSGILFHEQMTACGCQSLVVLPLVHQGSTVACLILVSAQLESFDGAEMRLLSELADDISFALDHIDKASRLSYLAYYDALTGFANRTLFLERLAQNISATARTGDQFLVVVADLERFDTINDIYGRKVGDSLLAEVADRFSACIGDANAVARVGPDHFAAIIPFSGEPEVSIAAFEHKYQAWLGTPFLVERNELRIGARAGMALFPHDASDADALLKNAEAALKRAKKSGEKFVLFKREISEKVAERLALETQLRRALANHEFRLYYQPKVDLESRGLAGVEALMRWANPEYGLMSPAGFIGIMEETGMILEAGTWALRQATLDRAAWFRAGLTAPRIAVNVSSVQVRKPDFVSILREALTSRDPSGKDISAGKAGIDIEVTESVLLEHAEANIEKLQQLRATGIGIAIDDFGTGYSSLSYLAKLPVATLKIDRSFTAAMLDDPSIMTLVSTMITLAHSLKLKVVAEGVEVEEQAKILRLLRCDQMQGYLVSQPLSFEEMGRYLTRSPHASAATA